nr:tetratricopeptide repeat protein [Gammaproteobacteria bacterium]
SVFLDRRYPWVCCDEEPNIGSAGPTVTNTAFGLAQAMGFATLVFAGIDMCHSSDGYSHAQGSNEFDAGPMFGVANMRVTTNSGRTAETTPDFYNAIGAFGAQALAARANGMQAINPAPGAAVIEGVEHVPVGQLTIDRVDGDPFDTLHAAIDGDSPAQRRDNLAAMKRELARAHDRLRKITRLADEALACNDGLFGRGGKPADFRHKKRMDRIERQLDTKYADFSEIVKMFSARAFLHMPPSDRDWSDEEIEQAGKTYYNAYRDNAQAILQLVEQAQRRIDTAVIEESDTPDVERMLQQWQDDNIPGRAAVWRYRHPQPAAVLSPQLAQRFDAMDAAFRRILDIRDTGHAQKMRNEAALGPVRGKLQVLFKERNAVELTNLAAQLAKQDTDEARQLLALATGYRAEIDGHAEAAFDGYAALIDLAREQIAADSDAVPNPRLEDALRRMVVIALAEGWHDQALLILETLAGMAPAYQPQFAEMLRLTGNPEAAVDVYSAYLSRAPGDHVTLLRLGKLYQTMGSVDAARTAFTYILEQDPDNKAARSLLDGLGTAA